jgi:hypothetical protein
MTWKERYQKAHEEHFKNAYPEAYKSGFYIQPKYPIVAKSNGITQMICNFLSWKGHRATRINVMGRLIDGVEKQPSGAKIGVKKWLPSTTRKGTADIGSTIKINGIGCSVMWEIKIGNDRPSEFQLKEKQREEMAGGKYFFVKTPEDFFEKYDSLFVNL